MNQNNVVGFFFQFDDTGDLYHVGMSGGPVTQVAWTRGAPADKLENAGLAKFRWDYMVAMHETNALLYFSFDPEDGRETLVMTDVDVDGTIDEISVLDSAGMDALFGAEPGRPRVRWLAD